MTKLGVTTAVGNQHLHPQWFSSFLSGTQQERHRLIICCTAGAVRVTELYPQKGMALYINIKNKLYKNSLFLFFISLSVFFPRKGVIRSRAGITDRLAIFCAEGFIQQA